MTRLRILLALGLWLGASGCSGLDRRVAYRPYRPVGTGRAAAIASRGQPAPRTNPMPERLARFFPGFDRTRGSAAPEALVASRATPAVPEAREPFVSPLTLARSFREPPPAALPVALNIEVYPDDPRPGAIRPAGRPGPRDEATHQAQAETSDEPASLPKIVEAGEPAPEAEPAETAPEAEVADAQPEPEMIDEMPTPDSPSAESASVSAADPDALPPLVEASETTEPIKATKPAEPPPAPRPTRPRPVVVLDADTNGDPDLAGRPRMPLVRPIGLPAELPPPSFPKTYYEPQQTPRTRSAASTAKIPSTPPPPRRTWHSRLVQRWRGFRDLPPSTRWRAGDFREMRNEQ